MAAQLPAPARLALLATPMVAPWAVLCTFLPAQDLDPVRQAWRVHRWIVALRAETTAQRDAALSLIAAGRSAVPSMLGLLRDPTERGGRRIEMHKGRRRYVLETERAAAVRLVVTREETANRSVGLDPRLEEQRPVDLLEQILGAAIFFRLLQAG